MIFHYFSVLPSVHYCSIFAATHIFSLLYYLQNAIQEPMLTLQGGRYYVPLTSPDPLFTLNTIEYITTIGPMLALQGRALLWPLHFPWLLLNFIIFLFDRMHVGIISALLYYACLFLRL